ncbi:MAG TPA: hypothetical protein VIG69_15775 [Candidatus Methylomirabilis sp.]
MVVWHAAAGAAAGEGRIIYLYRDALWSANPDGTGARPLTRGMPVYAYDVAPDGGRVAFAVGAWRGDRKRRELVGSELWVVNADGAGLRRLALPAKVRGPLKRVGRLQWSRDGQYLAFDVPGGPTARAGGGALFAVHLADGAVHAVARGQVQAFEWTPDGQIRYRQAVPGEEGQAEWLVSPAGAPHPLPASSATPAGRPAADTTAATTGNDPATAPPPLPPDAAPAPQPPSPPPASTPGGGAPRAGSSAGAD